MGTHRSKYKASESMSRHNPNKKQNQPINKKKGKNPMQIGPIAMK
jgi:hypothetical protein